MVISIIFLNQIQFLQIIATLNLEVMDCFGEGLMQPSVTIASIALLLATATSFLADATTMALFALIFISLDSVTKASVKIERIVTRLRLLPTPSTGGVTSVAGMMGEEKF